MKQYAMQFHEYFSTTLSSNQKKTSKSDARRKKISPQAAWTYT